MTKGLPALRSFKAQEMPAIPAPTIIVFALLFIVYFFPTIVRFKKSLILKKLDQ
jgi:hypothetical protein